MNRCAAAGHGGVRAGGGIAALVCLTLVGAACAARAPSRPAGTSTPDPTAVTAFAEATRACTALTTVTGEIRLSGRAGAERIRGTLHAGLQAPAAVRFEAVAPFGPPVFILAGRDNRASLLLPRDNRVLRDADVAALLERLTGLALSAAEIRLLLTGCLVEGAAPGNGRAWASGWRAVDLGTGVTAYLRARAGVTAVVAADHGEWRLDYEQHQGGFPRVVRIRNAADRAAPDAGVIDIRAELQQLEINTAIDAKAFAIDEPAGVVPIELDDLRAVAPLRGPGER